MPDFALFEIGNISMIVLVIGLVEAAKKLGLRGSACQVLAIALGALMIGLSQAIQLDMIPADTLPWIDIVIVGLGGGLAASGIFDLIKRQIKKAP